MEWQPIETAPRNGTEILTIRDNGFIAKAVWYDNPFGRKDTVIENASGKWWSVTHWMPLPPAPGDARADLTPSPEVVKELVEAAKAMLDRHVLYCGGPGLPHAGHTDEKLFNRLSAALEAAPHVNETPKSEHDAGDVLSALSEAEALHIQS